MPNALDPVADILIMEATLALRDNSIMPLLVSRDLDGAAAQKNKIIQVPVWPSVPVQTVTPGSANPTTDLTPDTVDITLDTWEETRWKMNDQEIAEVMDSRVVPKAVTRAVISHADSINAFILGKMKDACFNQEPAASPSDKTDLINLRKLLNDELVPEEGRSLVVDNTIEAELLADPLFHQVNQSGETAALREGSLGRKFGFAIHRIKSTPSHTTGSAAGRLANGAVTANPAVSGGTQDIAVDTGTGDFENGDILTFAGHSQVYSVVDHVGSGPESQLTIAPQLRANVADNEAITKGGASYTMGGLAFSQPAFVFGSRPLQTQVTPGVIVRQETDPLSGLSLRMLVEYINREVIWSMDILFGGAVVYPEMMAVLTN